MKHVSKALWRLLLTGFMTTLPSLALAQASGWADEDTGPKVEYSEPDVQMWRIESPLDGWRQAVAPTMFSDHQQGSIDFWVQYSPDFALSDQPGTLVALSNGYDTVFQISMVPSGNAIAVSNAAKSDYGEPVVNTNYANFDFTDGLIHHVSVVSKDDLSVVYVDGKNVGSASLGYAPAITKRGPVRNLQLSIGSLDGQNNVYQGHVGGVRVWAGQIPGETLFSAAFKRDRDLLNVSWAKSLLLAHLSNDAGVAAKPQLRMLSTLHKPNGVWMSPKFTQRVQVDSSVAAVEGGDPSFVPQEYTQLIMTRSDSVLARFAANTNGGRAPQPQKPRGADIYGPSPASKPTPVNTSVQDVQVPYGFRLVKAAGVGGRAASVIPNTTLSECAARCNAASEFKCVAFDYVARTKRCELNDRTEPLRQGMRASMAFIATGASTQVASQVAQTPVAPEPQIEKRSPMAVQAPSTLSRDAIIPVIVALTFKPFKSAQSPETVTAALFKPSGRNIYRAANGATLRLDGSEYLSMNNLSMRRSSRTETDLKSQTEITNEFMVSNQVRGRDSGLAGWDPSKLNPFDFSKPQGGRKAQLFEHSLFGYKERASMVVPKGFMLIDSSSGEGHKKHVEVTTEEAMHKELAASIKVHGSADFVKGAASFSANAGFRTRAEQLRNGTKAMTMAQISNSRALLLLDKPNMQITSAFKQAVESAAQRPNRQAARAIVEEFGTHYIHSMDLGGRMTQIIEMDAKTWGIAKTLDRNAGAAVEARGGLPGTANVTAGVEGAVSDSEMKSFRQAVTSSVEKWEYSGGSGGADPTTWNVAEATMVPIYMDMRPISEILAPPFFTDPAIFSKLRHLVREEMAAYMQRSAKPLQRNTAFRAIMPQGPKPKEKMCKADKWMFINSHNRDDKREGGGVWMRIELPESKIGTVHQFSDGCHGGSHGDGPGDMVRECNAVCWQDVKFTCGTNAEWFKDPKSDMTWTADCSDSGITNQQYLKIGNGNAPWKEYSGKWDWKCELISPYGKDKHKRPSNCPEWKGPGL